MNKVAMTESLESIIDIEERTSAEANLTSGETCPSFQQSKSTRNLLEHTPKADVHPSETHKINSYPCNDPRDINSIPHLSLLPPLDITSLISRENSEEVRENIAYIECHPEKSNYAVPGGMFVNKFPCTIVYL
jgi:hypothetical protein